MAHNTLAPWAEVVPAADGRGPRRMTAAELFDLGDEGSHHELVEGVLVQMTPPGGEHGVLTSEISAALVTFVKAHGLGQVLTGEPGFLISRPGEPDTVLAPDVAFVRTDHLPAKGTPERQGYWRLAPDVVVEVASPSQRKNELAAKALAWLAAGARLVWVVWPEAQQVDAWSSGADLCRKRYAGWRRGAPRLLSGADGALRGVARGYWPSPFSHRPSAPGAGR